MKFRLTFFVNVPSRQMKLTTIMDLTEYQEYRAWLMDEITYLSIKDTNGNEWTFPSKASIQVINESRIKSE